MAASGKTKRLGLCLWEPTDKPQRTDFREDNEKLEELVGAHLAQAALHLTSAEKSYVKAPLDLITYTGNGMTTRSMLYSRFKNPSFMLVFAQGKPPVEPENGGVKVYFAVSSTNKGGTVGLSADSSAWVVRQQTAADAGSGFRYCMNEPGVAYTAVIFR